jgi:menaquinol-cytochrome c reductase iron-sulfur subunit
MSEDAHGVSEELVEDPLVLSRRRLLNRISLALSGLAGAVVSVPILAYLLSPLLQKPIEQWRDLGLVENFRIGATVEVAFDEPSSLPWAGQTARTAVWLRRTGEQQFTAFGLNCTHLGCPVNWREGAALFLCPCHGGVYYADGSVAGGPPPHPLVRYNIRIADNNRVQVLTQPLTQTISQG